MEQNFKSTESKNIEIFVRILPSMDVSESFLKIADNRKDIYVRCIQDMKRDRILKSPSPIFWRFPTDGIFYNDSQEEVYKGVTKNLLDNVLGGVHCVLLSQGQIGTGKSFTIGGLRHSYEHRGIIVRLLSDMFEEKRIRKYSNAIEYRMNYVEIYKNQVKDLLASKNEERRFNIRDASKQITLASVNSEDETLKTIFEGEARKEIGKGTNYEASHRCTSVLTFHVENTSLITSRAVASHAKVNSNLLIVGINLVDMAGVDFFGKSSCQKSTEHLRNANLEKTLMEQYILALHNSQKSKTSYRQSNSNLIKYLGDAFHLGSLLRFIGHVRFTNEDLVLTLSTLRFSSIVKKLKPEKMKYNFGSELTQDTDKLRAEVSGLREELELNEMLLNQEASTNLSPERVKRIEEDAIDFINGNLDDLTLLSVSQAQILLKKFKEIFAKLVL
ncbi:kinesin-like protein KIF9 [Athalia rosae]|uniref:kinesin-like protein KIF9 n=1 Tax=Athalia rosae TaxID=37344 RepID=UPI002033B108|nr:kinesin-like protein KIF9 [Athalia rosae]